MHTAIVTGASGNLGNAVIKKLLEDGFHVTGTVVPGHPIITDSRGKNFETAVVDLSQEEAAQQFVELVTLKQHHIDVAVLTVGGFAMGNFVDTSSADVLKQYRLNFETAYHVARPVFKQMKKQGSGRIFLIGSKPGLNMKEGVGKTAYGLAKSLLFNLAEIMNYEAKGTDIVTSVIVPSTIDTPQNRQSMPDADYTKWVTPEAIADLISFYCSPSASAIRQPIIKVYNGS